MKSFLLSVALLGTCMTGVLAQSRVSIVPAYWFNATKTSYQVDVLNPNGSRTLIPADIRSTVSSVGLTARYHVTPKWDVSVGALYYRNAARIANWQGPYGEPTPFTSEGWQVPVLVNYRLTDRRLSPYFSAGVVFAKSKTFTADHLWTEGVVGAGVDYRFNSRLSLLIQPTASYSFYKPAVNPASQTLNYKAYSVGAQTQLIWRL
ncbi:outer membrane beta-barrel protein [Fibrella aquatica]|uniref:outer membrane beta-barrel protein n=1 Tax=Fibrella aquatica TaxID=3242487 RepID=UPI003521DE97